MAKFLSAIQVLLQPGLSLSLFLSPLAPKKTWKFFWAKINQETFLLLASLFSG